MAAIPVAHNPNDPGRGPVILGVTWLFTSLCAATVALRLYVRAKIHRVVSSDDWIMLAAMAFQFLFQAFATEGVLWGIGKHAADLTPDEIVQSTKWKWLSVAPSIAESALARISIAILLNRLFCSGGGKRWLFWYLWIFTIVQTIIAIVAIIIMYVQVSPIEGLWNIMLPARRWNPDIQLDVVYLLQSFFAFSDLTFVLFPVAIIWKLNMPLRRKLGLATLLGLSLVTMAATIEKTIVTTAARLKAADPHTDVPYETSLAVVWSAVDQSLVIILGCVPPLYGFVAPFINSVTSGLTSGLSSSLLALSGRSRKTYHKSSSSDEVGGGGAGSNAGHHGNIELGHAPYPHSSDGTGKKPVVLGRGEAMEKELLTDTVVDRTRIDNSDQAEH